MCSTAHKLAWIVDSRGGLPQGKGPTPRSPQRKEGGGRLSAPCLFPHTTRSLGEVHTSFHTLQKDSSGPGAAFPMLAKVRGRPSAYWWLLANQPLMDSSS